MVSREARVCIGEDLPARESLAVFLREERTWSREFSKERWIVLKFLRESSYGRRRRGCSWWMWSAGICGPGRGGVYEEQMVLGVELGGSEFGHGDGRKFHIHSAEAEVIAGNDGSLDILSLE